MTAGPGRFGQPELPDRPPPAGLFARGYDRVGTDELVTELTARIQECTTRLYTVERENRRLRAERSAEEHSERVSQVHDSIGVLSTAQRDADQVMAEADAYRERVAAESERLRTEARRAAEALLADTQARARDIEQQARRTQEQARLTQDELERQTGYLRSVREAAGTQVLGFLNSMVDHLAAEFGAADPAAVPGGAAPAAGPTPARADRAAARLFPPLPAVPAAHGGSRGAGSGQRARARREPRGHVRHLAGR